MLTGVAENHLVDNRLIQCCVEDRVRFTHRGGCLPFLHQGIDVGLDVLRLHLLQGNAANVRFDVEKDLILITGACGRLLVRQAVDAEPLFKPVT